MAIWGLYEYQEMKMEEEVQALLRELDMGEVTLDAQLTGLHRVVFTRWLRKSDSAGSLGVGLGR